MLVTARIAEPSGIEILIFDRQMALYAGITRLRGAMAPACFEFLSRLVQSEHLMVQLCHFLKIDCSRGWGDEDKILLQ